MTPTTRIALLALVLASCVGGQPPVTKAQSQALGDRSRDVPPETRQQEHENHWTAAARGHGAAGPFSPSELARMDRESAPGGNVQADAGVR